MTGKIAVFAGTLVDTQMGADVLAAHGIDHIQYPVSKDPHEQHMFQISSADEKHAVMKSMLKNAMSDGCDAALIYCNSLAGSVSFPGLSEELSFKIVTPFDAYRNLAKKYRRIAAIAFNPIALSGVELAMSNENPELLLFTANLMPLVFDIEKGLSPDEIIDKNNLIKLCDYFISNGCEALILGCTHFPYFKEALSRRTELFLIDPAEDMIALLSDLKK